MMHPIPQKPQRPEERHDSAERPGRDDSWTALAKVQQRNGYPTFRANFDDTEGRRP